jgi:hypothetical protein
VDGARKPISGNVILIPAKEHRSNPARYKTVQSDASGHFTMEAIPPGDYLLFAWEWSPNTAEQNAEYLQQFESQGTTVVVRSGSVVDVRITQIRSTE